LPLHRTDVEAAALRPRKAALVICGRIEACDAVGPPY